MTGFVIICAEYVKQAAKSEKVTVCALLPFVAHAWCTVPLAVLVALYATSRTTPLPFLASAIPRICLCGLWCVPPPPRGRWTCALWGLQWHAILLATKMFEFEVDGAKYSADKWRDRSYCQASTDDATHPRISCILKCGLHIGRSVRVMDTVTAELFLQTQPERAAC